jgi:hypothetical protein
MAQQRKLTQEDLDFIVGARSYVKSVAELGKDLLSALETEQIHEALRRFDACETHGTNDGKPWVEPQPEGTTELSSNESDPA